MREVAIRVRSRTVPSTPRLNFDPASGFIAMGSSTNPASTDRTSLVHVHAIACPPGVKAVSFTVAVAEGPWQTMHVLRKPTRESPMAGEQSSDSEGQWDAHLELVETKGDVALAFHYSSKTQCETRIAMVKVDGTVTELSGNGTQGAGGMLNSVASLSAEEYAGIKEFQFQKRPYQYVGFRNVSLEAGYRTRVEIATEAREPEAKAADPVEAIELKVAQAQLEKTLSELQQTQLDLLAPRPSEQSPGEQEAASARLNLRLRALEEQAANLRAVLREKHRRP
jgi:hypothetical protein